MIDAPKITQTEAQHAAVIHFTIPRDEIRNVMGPGISEVLAAVEAQGMAPAGAWFSHHFSMEPGIFDFEIGVPVAVPIQPSGRVKPGRLPAATVARTIFHGNYEGLGEAWGEFESWVAANGHERAPDLWESYVVGPESSPDPADWRTELNQPLIA